MEESKESARSGTASEDADQKGGAGDATATSSVFIKKPARKFGARGLRGRREEDEEEKINKNDSDDDKSDKEAKGNKSSSDDETTVVTKKRRTGHNPLIQSTGSFRTVAKTHKAAARHRVDTSSESGSNSSDYESTDDEEREAAMKKVAASQRPVPSSSRSKEDEDEPTQSTSKGKEKETKETGEEVYTGMKNYKTYKKEDPTNPKKDRFGPKSAPDFLKGTVVWDYKPDICKDYKETGYCGFGDSCIFLHDRTDYKHGWQIEMEMAKGTYGEDDEDADKYKIPDSELDDERIPFRCLICRETFKDPVVTKCKHYFCEKCALEYYRKESTRCYVCQQQTGGVFNPAKAIMKRFNLVKAAKKVDAGQSSSSESEHEEEEEKVEAIEGFGGEEEEEGGDSEQQHSCHGHSHSHSHSHAHHAH